MLVAEGEVLVHRHVVGLMGLRFSRSPAWKVCAQSSSKSRFWVSSMEWLLAGAGRLRAV
jgi:hypothetical protein